MERALFFLKPDAVVRRHVGAKVLSRVVALGCIPKVFVSLRPSRQFLEEKHYYMHKGKPFFDWLLNYITSESLIVTILEGNNIIPKIRQALGPATVERAVLESPSSIRAQYGMFRGVNLAHASDSESSALHEVGTWCSNFSLRDDDQALETLEDYVSRNSECEFVESVLYRRIAEQLENRTMSRGEAKERIFTLLKRENTLLDNAALEHFIGLAMDAI
jgi:nucleoside-diphosphate kinase